MRAKIDHSKIKNILIVSLSNIGDAILTTPVISLLREHFPSSCLTIVAGPKTLPLFSNCRTINQTISFDKRISWIKKLKLVLDLRKQKFDLAIDLRNTAIPILIGAPLRTSLMVDRSSLSMRRRHLDQLRFLLPVEEAENHFDFFSNQEKQSAIEKLQKVFVPQDLDHLVVIAPGAGSELKRWTISGFANVASYWVQKGKTVILIGDASERKLGEEIQRLVAQPIANLIGVLSIRESAGLISQAGLVIANDSAVMHLAHELNRPTVSIFGPTNEKKYARMGENRRVVRLNLECTPCEQARCRLERRICLDDLTAQQVIEAAESLPIYAPH